MLTDTNENVSAADNASNIFWIVSQFAASHVKYYEGGIWYISAGWSAISFVVVLTMWYTTRSNKHAFDAFDHGIARTLKHISAAASSDENSLRQEVKDLTQQIKEKDAKIETLEARIVAFEMNAGGYDKSNQTISSFEMDAS